MVVVLVITTNRIRHDACGVAFAEDPIGSQRARTYHSYIVMNEGMCGTTAPKRLADREQRKGE